MSNTVDIMAEEFKIAYPLTYDAVYEKGRADAIDEIQRLIRLKIIDSLGIADATKYENQNELYGGNNDWERVYARNTIDQEKNQTVGRAD